MAHEDTIISLFSGAGGMSLGFSQAGLAPVLAADISVDACNTYQENLGKIAFNIDLSINNQKFDKFVNQINRPLAIIGGPPCQGFSSAGLKKDSKQNKLIFHYLSLVSRIRPRWFIFENVEGLLTYDGGSSIFDLTKEFIEIGYKVRLEKVNFAAYGLPQARKRVILIGNSIGVNFRFPPFMHSFNAGKHKSFSSLPYAPNVSDSLDGLGEPTAEKKDISLYNSPLPLNPYDRLMRVGNTTGGVTLHHSSISSEFTLLLEKLEPGQTMKDLPSKYWHDSYHKRAFRRVMDGTPTEKRGGAPSGIKRLDGSLNALTITSAATREFIHPVENRPLTLREAARLQSFPDNYRFMGTDTSIAVQIGNAFPPLIAKVFAEHILSLDGLCGADQNSFYEEGIGALIGYHLTDAQGMSPALSQTNSLLHRLVAYQYPLL